MSSDAVLTVPAEAARTRDWALLRAISLPMIVGVLVRAAPVVSSPFPLNDGGMFYVMVRDLQHAGFVLPQSSTYNGLHIPFAYPPLGFYLVGIVNSLTHIPLLELFQWWPLLFSLLTLPVFWMIAEEMLPTRFHALIATFAFALLPRAYEWLIAGGGITRAPGSLFGMLAFYAALRMFQTERSRYVVVTAVTSGLTALTHPEAALATAVSIAVLVALRCRSRRAVLQTILAGLGALLVTSPWLVYVLLRFGPGVLLSAGGTGPNAVAGTFYLLLFDFTGEPFWHILAGLGLLGMLHQVSRRSYVLPIWVIADFLVDSRAASTYTAVPLALLVAFGLIDVVLPALSGRRWEDRRSPAWPIPLLSQGLVAILLAATLAMTLTSSLLLQADTGGPVHALSPANVAAMRWVSQHTPTDARFVVLTGANWWNDATSEWFPAIADRASVATQQGYEWLGLSAWQRQSDSAAALQTCAGAGLPCIEAWSAEYRAPLNYVYLPKGPLLGPLSASDCCTTLRIELARDSSYREIYDGLGATIFQRVRAEP